MRKIYLYTPWCEQGLSYDAKAIEKIALENKLEPIITFDKKRKIQWDCIFEKINRVPLIINENDYFFCFERIPHKYIQTISNRTKNIYLMINYEYYDKEFYNDYILFKKIFCKSKYAYKKCIEDGLTNAKYMPWILWNFPISNLKENEDIIKVVFNGGTGGYKDRRNLSAVINLFKDYKETNVHLTIKLTNDLRRWTKKILKNNLSFIKSDDRITLIQDTMNRFEYIDFLKQFDLNLCPSKYEGFGLTLLEGLHSRLASITINQSPMNEIVIHNENGLCVENHVIDKIRNQAIFDINREEFYLKFKKLVNNPEKMMEMKKNTKNLIHKNEIYFNDYFYNEIK